MKTAIALGTFDGVHIGHIAVLETAAKSGFTPVAVAFKVPPKAFLRDDNIIITPWQEKAETIKKIGIENIYFLDFQRVKDITAEEFFNFLYEKYSPALIVCGYNYTFGKGGKGDTHKLKQLCEEKGIKLSVLPQVTAEDIPVSSSYIRSLLRNGDIKAANRLLYNNFSVSGTVLHGDERGRTIGFPTFNQEYPKDKARVKFGVYFAKTEVDGKEYYGMTNIGIRPTYPSNVPLCETHIFGFSGDLYGKELTVTLLDFIREEKKFSSLKELEDSIKKDKETILKLIEKE